MAHEYGSGAMNPGNGGMKYPKAPMSPDAGLDLGPKNVGEENLTAEGADAIARKCAAEEGYGDPNAEDPTSQGVGGEPLGNRK